MKTLIRTRIFAFVALIITTELGAPPSPLKGHQTMMASSSSRSLSPIMLDSNTPRGMASSSHNLGLPYLHELQQRPEGLLGHDTSQLYYQTPEGQANSQRVMTALQGYKDAITDAQVRASKWAGHINELHSRLQTEKNTETQSSLLQNLNRSKAAHADALQLIRHNNTLGETAMAQLEGAAQKFHTYLTNTLTPLMLDARVKTAIDEGHRRANIEGQYASARGFKNFDQIRSNEQENRSGIISNQESERNLINQNQADAWNSIADNRGVTFLDDLATPDALDVTILDAAESLASASPRRAIPSSSTSAPSGKTLMEQRYEAEQLTATNKSSLPDQPQFTDMQRALQRGRELAGKARGQAIESNQPRSLSQRRGVSPVNPLEGFEPLSNESTNQSMRPQLPQANPAARSSSATGNRRPMAQVSRSRTPIDQARPLSAYEQTLQERNQRPQGTKKQVTFGRPGTQFSPEEVQLFQELDGANPVWNSKRFAEGNYEAEKARYNEWIRTRSLR